MKKYWQTTIKCNFKDGKTETFIIRLKKEQDPNLILDKTFEYCRTIWKTVKEFPTSFDVTGDFASELTRELDGYVLFMREAVDDAFQKAFVGYGPNDVIPIDLEHIEALVQAYDDAIERFGKIHRKLHFKGYVNIGDEHLSQNERSNL